MITIFINVIYKYFFDYNYLIFSHIIKLIIINIFIILIIININLKYYYAFT